MTKSKYTAIPAPELQPGMVVDLQNDKFADPTGREVFTKRHAVVMDVTNTNTKNETIVLFDINPDDKRLINTPELTKDKYIKCIFPSNYELNVPTAQLDWV